MLRLMNYLHFIGQIKKSKHEKNYSVNGYNPWDLFL